MRRLVPHRGHCIIVICGVALFVAIPSSAARMYGPPSPRLSLSQVVQYSIRLLWYDGLLTRPAANDESKLSFTVTHGESVDEIARQLQLAGLISDSGMFRDYLIYTGLDTSIQAGNYRLGPSMSIVDIAHAMQDATPADITFVVLPGWRMEEISLSLPTSGLNITPTDFMKAASGPRPGFDFLVGVRSMEGFLYPDTYTLPRVTTVDQLLDALVRNFALHLTSDLSDGFSRQGLSVYQAVTLASIVERETMHPEEMPMIASVYLNRLKIGMNLDADPTVQYALGYNSIQQTWWTNPLSADDLKFASPYNTYLNPGLPPTPISNPGLDALRAVASPADTNYYYFQAKCDGSGYHVFAKTFQEHLQNLCP
ncbi:MAG: endolytic transglycosylase MltG [Chloroflexi bacterium]|nr:endolytic transglycosylase MltG [Chloroflexota bacterium]